VCTADDVRGRPLCRTGRGRRRGWSDRCGGGRGA